MQSSTYCTDWINSHPVFYNTKTLKASSNINDVVEWGNFEFDNEGLENYLRFGYIVFEKTVYKNVCRLPANSDLTIGTTNGVRDFRITRRDDQALLHLDGQTSAEECLEKIRLHVGNFEKNNHSKRLLLPLSGGHDSRLLLSMIDDKSKIDAVTYDISMSQKFSFESINAQLLAHHFKLNWKNIVLTEYFKEDYCQKNFRMFGAEMPIHASYHMEMYETIDKTFDASDRVILSGSVGDWWSGDKVPLPVPRSWHDAERLFFNHGLCIPEDFIEIKADRSYNESVIQPQIDLICDSKVYRTIFSRRGRVGLSGYIARVAESYAPTYTPFYDIDIATSQLKLSQSDRDDRSWQKKYFQSIGIGFGLTQQPNFSCSTDYSQDLQAACKAAKDGSLARLKPHLFRGIVKQDFIVWINSQLDRLEGLPIDMLKSLANVIYSSDNARANRSEAGLAFDAAYRAIIDMKSLNQAIASWSVLLPLQMSMQLRGDK